MLETDFDYLLPLTGESSDFCSPPAFVGINRRRRRIFLFLLPETALHQRPAASNQHWHWLGSQFYSSGWRCGALHSMLNKINKSKRSKYRSNTTTEGHTVKSWVSTHVYNMEINFAKGSKCQRKGVGRQNSQNLVNVVCKTIPYGDLGLQGFPAFCDFIIRDSHYFVIIFMY